MTRLWLRTQRFEFRIIDLLPRDEEIESGVKLLKVGILGYLGMNVLHVGCILELGDLDPEFFITGKFDRRRKASSTELGCHIFRTEKLVGQAPGILEQLHDWSERLYKGLCLSSGNSVQEDRTVRHSAAHFLT